MLSSQKKPFAVITGAGSGFGAAIATALEQRGWQVIAGLRHSLALHQHGDTPFQLDICSASDRLALVQHIQNVNDGQLDLLINNAGMGLFGALEDVTEEQLRNQFEVNLLAPALLTRALLPALRSCGGRVINLSSALVNWPMPFTSGYCASKSAMDAFSESLHYELAPYDVQVALVEPGAHKTPFLQKSSWAEPTDDHGSIYYSAVTNYRKFRDKQSKQQNLPGADKVARIVLDLVSCKRMPVRVRVGMDARMLNLLRRTLPSGLLRAVKQRMFKSWFVRQKPD